MMKMIPFQTEQFFVQYEFNTPYQLCNSDCETMTVAELLALADVPLDSLGSVSLGYTESQGDPALRRQIAACYQHVTAEDVIELGAPIEGIFLAAQALLQPGDEVIVPSPVYDALANSFAHVVGEESIRRWKFHMTEDGWQLDLDELRKLFSPKTRLLVLNFPHNPTGYVPLPEEWQEMVNLAQENQVPVFCDEIYAGLFHQGTAPIASAVDLNNDAIVLSGLSKTFGLPGLRSGWLVVKDPIVREKILNWKYYTTICSPSPVEFLASAALQCRETLRQRSQALIDQNLALAEAFFARWPTLFCWRKPRGGSVALVEMAVPSVTAFAHQMAQEAGVLILPGAALGAEDCFFRMGFGRAGFSAALEQFESYLKSRFPSP